MFQASCHRQGKQYHCAFGSDEMKILALQWHPERKFATANALEDTRRLVINFIQRHIK